MNQFLQFPNFDPIAFSIGPISLHWYGAMYLFGVLGALFLAKRRANKPNSNSEFGKEECLSMVV